MPKEYSPFTPGQPVPVEFFVGRQSEVSRLRDKVAASANGRLQVAFLSGERGIGKSSLASFVRYLSEKDNGMLGIHTFLGGASSLEEMTRKIFDRLLKESMNESWYGKIKDFFGDHVKQAGLFGVSLEFGATREDLRNLANDFAPVLKNLSASLKDEKQGIFIILDDINGLASSRSFANWLKSLVDEIAISREPLPLCLLLVGIDERRRALISCQESLARILDPIEISPWNENETFDFYSNAFSEINIKADKEALSLMSRYTGGLPMLAHEIGDAVFKADNDNHINEDDAIAGVLVAADIVGNKYLEPQVLKAIKSESYRSILHKLSEKPLDLHFKRADVLGRLNANEKKAFDNFIKRMKSLGAIVQDGAPGSYKFSNQLHHTYFWLEAARARRKAR